MTDQDLDDFFARTRNREGSPDDSKWHTVCLMARFCRRVYKGESVEPWILGYLADAFAKIGSGGAWNDELPLPWMPRDPIRSATESKELQVYCDVSNAKANKPNKLMSVIIEDVALAHNISQHKAKADYYKWKSRITKKGSDN